MLVINPLRCTEDRTMSKLHPVFLLGNGIRNNPELIEFICSLGIPVLITWQAIDLLPEDSPVFCGRPGVVGQRAANIIQQKCNILMCIGARLDMEQMGHRPDNFAPNAKKIIYDVDREELDKFPADWTVIQVDLNKCKKSMVIYESSSVWLKWCKDLYNSFRYELDGIPNSDLNYVDPYYFINELSNSCKEGEIIVPGSSGMQSCALMQAFKVKKDQRILLCNTIGSMGLEPMAIGAAIASGKRVICITGDGGFHMNVQELEVVRRLGLVIKYFVFCNEGYGSIASMQDNHLGHRIASDKTSGLTFPPLYRIATTYGFNYREINNNISINNLDTILNSDCTELVRVNSSLKFHYATKIESTLVNGKFVTDAMEDISPKISNLSEIMNEVIND